MKQKHGFVFLTVLFTVLIFLMIAALTILFFIPDYNYKVTDMRSVVVNIFPLVCGISFFVLSFIIIDVYRKPKAVAKVKSDKDNDDALYKYLTGDNNSIITGSEG